MSSDQRSPLDYGMNRLWSTPIRLRNLLQEGIVEPGLHEWLENFADSAELVSGPLDYLRDPSKRYSRYDLSVFASPQQPELIRIKGILVAQADQYIRDEIVDPLPAHDKYVVSWFVIQHPQNAEEAPAPHYHESGDVAMVYYLTPPSNRSGNLVMFDPRGTVARGGRALPLHKAFVEFFPRRGDLIIFPRYIKHSTRPNTGATKRKVIAGIVAYDDPHRSRFRYEAQAEDLCCI